MAKSLAKLRERLKDYENTGLSPEEIYQIIAKQSSENSAVPTRKFAETLAEGLDDEGIEDALRESKEEVERTISRIKAKNKFQASLRKYIMAELGGNHEN